MTDAGSALRVMHVITADRLGGGMEVFLSRLATGLHRSGVEQLVVTRRGPELAEHLAAVGIRTARLSLHKRDPRSWLGLRWLAWSFRPQAIVSWLPHAARLVPSGPWLRVAQIGLYNSLRFYRRVDAMTVPSPDLARHFAELGFAAERIHVMPHFTDQPVMLPINRAEVGTPADAPVVVTCGRLYPLKACDISIRVIAGLPGVHLWLVGEGEEEGRLRALADDLGVAGRVHFLGWRQDVAAILAAADVMLFPSRQEVLGLVVLEAWCAGVPVVSASSEGARYLIRPFETGLIAPIDDVDALTRHTAAALSDPILRARIIAGGRARLEAEFTREATLDAYLRFFNAIRDRKADSVRSACGILPF